jgi:hypothetical protein
MRFDQMATLLHGIEGRRAIILITDGFDENSTIDVQAAVQKAQTETGDRCIRWRSAASVGSRFMVKQPSGSSPTLVPAAPRVLSMA